MLQISKLCPIEDVHYIESSYNPSDLSTKEGCSVSELGPQSFHQRGPNFFSWGREHWPVSSSYDKSDIPTEELKVRDKLVFSAAARLNFCLSKEHKANPRKAIESVLHYSNNLSKVTRIVA